MKLALICVVSAVYFLPAYSNSESTIGISYAFPNPSDSSQFKVQQAIHGISDKTINAIGRKYDRLNKFVIRRSVTMLKRMQKEEFSLQEKVAVKDSLKAKSLFAASQVKYKEFLCSLRTPVNSSNAYPLKEYVAGVDSIQTAFNFMQKTGTSIPGIPEDKTLAIQTTNARIRQFQENLQQATDIQQYVKQREQYLKDQLSGEGLGKELVGINKEAFYAQQQISEYKAMLTDRKTAEAKVLSSLNDIPAFSQFMQKNSYLGQLFGLPDNYGSVQSLVGLQTRSQIEQLLGQVAGIQSGNNNSGPDPAQYIHQQMQQAQQQLRDLRAKLSSLGSSGGNGDITMPQTRPNEERTKTWLKRLEYGFNLQTQQSTALLPSLANLSLTLGYKLNPRFSLGIGAAYRLGLGTGFNHVAFTNQGIGLRTYMDMYLKGNLGISGGLEYNYMQSFVKWPSINQPDIWQKSALVGIIKRAKVSAHKEATIQLLFDAFYREHVPASAPLILRVGYKFK